MSVEHEAVDDFEMLEISPHQKKKKPITRDFNSVGPTKLFEGTRSAICPKPGGTGRNGRGASESE